MLPLLRGEADVILPLPFVVGQNLRNYYQHWGEAMQADQRRADADEQNGPQREKDALEHAEYIAKRRSPRSPPAGGRMGRLLPSSVLLQSWNTSF